MNRREFLKMSGLVVTGIAAGKLVNAASLDIDLLPKDEQGKSYAEGYVFHDKSGSGIMSQGDQGIAGVCVSNGRDVVKTDRNGKWRLPVDESSVLFVIKPSGWQVPIGEHSLPKYFYVHRPNGSPKTKYPGTKPTGGMPKSIDFALKPNKESAKFRMVLFGDPQPRNQTEIDYIAHDVVEQAARDAAEVGAVFGLSLGDQMFDKLEHYTSLNSTISAIGLPWYSTVGNHDMNYDAPTNDTAKETFISHYGPNNYAFDYGKVHFIVLDNVMYHGATEGGYHGEFAEDALAFVQNDLALVPKDKLVFIGMHIPITDVENREALYRLIENRPHTFSVSAHTHVQAHHFLDKEAGWNGREPHHHLNHVTVCGSWWEGAPDERGIPHATMSDGGPNGYSIVEFDGLNYKVMFRPASRPSEEQMGIYLPEEISPADAKTMNVVVNVFAGSERSVVEVRARGGTWKKMTRFVGQDPYFLKLKELESSSTPPLGLKLPKASDTSHLWQALLPSELGVGTHSLEFRTTDMWGQTFTDLRVLRIV